MQPEMAGHRSGPASGEARPNRISRFLLIAAPVVVAAGLAAWWGASLWTLKLRVAFAHEQTRVFHDMVQRATTGDARQALGCLEYTIGYYPAGTKQVAGSRLDAIVESARRQGVHDILEVLRRKTGADFGDDPEDWLDPQNAARLQAISF